MTDELKKRLRSTVTQQDTEGEKYELPYNPDGPQAADHIEELEAKLAKAVEALRGWIDFANEEGMPVLLSDLEAAALTGAQKDGN